MTGNYCLKIAWVMLLLNWFLISATLVTEFELVTYYTKATEISTSYALHHILNFQVVSLFDTLVSHLLSTGAHPIN